MFWLLLACATEQVNEGKEELQTETSGIMESKNIQFLFSNSLIGEIEPCG